MSVVTPELSMMATHLAAAGSSPGAADSAVISESLIDPERFAVLYDRYAAMLHRYAGRRIGPGDAEDVVAATFLAAFSARRRYDQQRPDARPWLFGILTKELARRRRSEDARLRALARTEPVRSAAGHEDLVAARVSARAARGALATALADLAPEERDVLLLVAWGDLSYAEAAAAVEVPIGTVRSRLNRARRKVREALGGSDPTSITEAEDHQ